MRQTDNMHRFGMQVKDDGATFEAEFTPGLLVEILWEENVLLPLMKLGIDPADLMWLAPFAFVAQVEAGSLRM